MRSNTLHLFMFFVFCVSIYSSSSFACPPGQSRSSLGICLPNVDVPNLPNIPGSIGSESDRFIKNLARELQKTPEAIQECIQNVSLCAQQIISAPLALPIQAYIEGLYRQSEGKTYPFSQEFIFLAQPHYDFDLSRVTYAQDINTGSGMSVAYCDRIFFARNGNPWLNKDDLHHQLHELEHLGQCQKRGKQTFLAEYVLKVGADIARTGRFNVHDIHDFEVAADAKADQLTDMFWGRIQNRSTPIPAAILSQLPQPAIGSRCATPGGVCMARYAAPVGSQCGCGGYLGSIIQ